MERVAIGWFRFARSFENLIKARSWSDRKITRRDIRTSLLRNFWTRRWTPYHYEHVTDFKNRLENHFEEANLSAN